MSGFPDKPVEQRWSMPSRCVICGFDILGKRIELPLDKPQGPRYRHPHCRVHAQVHQSNQER